MTIIKSELHCESKKTRPFVCSNFDKFKLFHPQTAVNL